MGDKAILTMQPSYREYAEMAEYLAHNGFTEQQSETLVRVIAGLFARIEAYFERIREEDRKDRERIRREDKAYFERMQEKNAAYFERIRKEDKADRERLREEDKADRERLREEDKADRERLREEDKSDRERLREEDKSDRERIRDQDQQQWARLEAKVDAIQRQSVVTLSTLVLTIIGASIAYILSLAE
ncbi:MAG: hypothetical protein OXE81_09975 [Gammaproteobacteria bacterium]|nr:hypothetical protein [Gammaproteobacteria bacterium]